MVKIGLICWKQGGGTTDYLLKKPSKPWKKGLEVKKGEYKGKIPFEKALMKALEYHHDDVEVMFLNKFDEELLRQNDVNFLVSLNLLNFWEKGGPEYKRVYNIMKNPKMNIYPNLKEQFFLYNKGKYLDYYSKKGIPIAPSFYITKNRNPKSILKKAMNKGWESFILKPYRAYANYGIGKFEPGGNNTEKKLSKFLEKHKQYPGFVCQEVMKGFAQFWEVKTLWIQGKYAYYAAMKASKAVFKGYEINDEGDYGTISNSVLNDLKKMGKKIVSHYPKMNQYSNPPLFLRIDFGCCVGNTLDGKSYFLNEIEYAGCANFVGETPTKNAIDYWVDGYYKTALKFKRKKKTVKRKLTRGKRKKYN